MDKKATASVPTAAFVKILDNGSLPSYTAAAQNQQSIGPSPADIVAHLKLITAFSTLKESIVKELNEDPVKAWQLYVTNAVRRFVIFISAAKKGSVETLHEQLPPLDVLLIWYTFSKVPKVYYDFLMRNEFGQFHCIPFPLHPASLAIDNLTFEYWPAKDLKDNYTHLVSQFSNVPKDLVYNSVLDLELTYDVICPICSKLLLAGVKCTNYENTGFADQKFNQPKIDGCTCDFEPDITHENLRIRQLFADLDKKVPLPHTHRYYSDVYKSDAYNKEPSKDILANIKTQIKNEILHYRMEEDIAYSVHSCIIAQPNSFAKTIILRNYSQMNLIHSTVKDGVELPVDLVGAVMRQERFWIKYNELRLIHSPSLLETLNVALDRYARFQGLMANVENRGFLLPTMDIDFVWHTHQLFQKKYLDDTVKLTNGIAIDHYDKLEQCFIDSAFQTTCKLWQKTFGEDYTYCRCWYCDVSAKKSRPKRLFSSKRKSNGISKYLAERLGPLTHVSMREFIQLPSMDFDELRWKTNKKYYLMRLPWDEDAFDLPSKHFVVPVMDPINYKILKYYPVQLYPEMVYVGNSVTKMAKKALFGDHNSYSSYVSYIAYRLHSCYMRNSYNGSYCFQSDLVGTGYTRTGGGSGYGASSSGNGYSGGDSGGGGSGGAGG